MKRFVKMLSIFVLCLFGFGAINFAFFNDFNKKENQLTAEANTVGDFLEILKSSVIYDNEVIQVNLLQDVDLTEQDLSSFEEFYQTKRVFKGVFNGNGHTIKGLKLYSCENAYGLFPWAENAVITDLRIEGTTNFVIDSNNLNEVYAGTLFGNGQNVTIQNCEIDCSFTTTLKGSEEVLDYVDVYSKFNFGSAAGKISETSQGETLIKNVINYGDVSLNISSASAVSEGGIIGSSQGNIQNCVNYGNLNIIGNADASLRDQYIGGIVGYVSGSNSTVKNACFLGGIAANNLTRLNLKKGAILGGASSSSTPKVSNINYSYWTSDLNGVGAGLVVTSDSFKKVDAINKDFLQNAENFDQIQAGFDFDEVFIMISSKLHLQNFQTFKYSFSTTYDRSKVLDTDSVKIKHSYFSTITGQIETEEIIDVTSEQLFKYGDEITFVLPLKAENYGYYHLNNVFLGGNSVDINSLDAVEKYDENGKITGYEITVTVNDNTKGSYAFEFDANVYYCTVKVSDEAKEGDQGGVSVKDSTSSSSSAATSKVDVEFKINSKTKTVKAEGKGIYNFSYWELYYEGKTTPEENFEFKDNSYFNIKYGEGVFNKPFTLIAYFDDADAIEVDFGQIDRTKIKDIVLNGIVWNDENIKIPKKVVPFEIVVVDKYVLNTDTFISDFEKVHGENTITKSSDPIRDEVTGTTTYKFSLQLINASIEDNYINLAVNAEKDKTSGGQNLTWLWITIAAVSIIGIGFAIFFIVRKKRGGPRGGRSSKSSTKKAMYSYDDYYI